MGYFWHNIGKPLEAHQEQGLWESLVKHSSITAGFEHQSTNKGEALLKRYIEGDIIFAYANSFGALGFGYAIGPESYRFSPIARHGSDHRHETDIRWATITDDVRAGIPVSHLAKLGIRHPRHTRERIQQEIGDRIIELLRDNFDKLSAMPLPSIA